MSIDASAPGPKDLDPFFALSLEMLAIAGADGFFQTLNPAWEAVLGWSRDELVAQPLVAFAHPDDADATDAKMAGVAYGQPAMSFVNRFRCKDGTYRDLRWSASADETGAIYAVARDVTEYRAALAEARDNDELWRSVMETTVEPIILIDEVGTVVSANLATTTVFGYSNDEMLGNNVSMLMPEPFRSEHDGYLHRYLATGEARIIGIGREVEAQRRDGTTFPMALAVNELVVSAGRRFVGVIHDLSDRHAAEKLLQEANESLEAKVRERTVDLERSNRDLERFAYIASHDLRAPLRNVRQGLELLDEHLVDTVGTSFDDEANELRGLVVGAVGRMESLIAGLLSYSRVQRQGSPMTELVDLNVAFHEVSELLQLDLTAAGASVTADSLPTVMGDASQLRQLLQNLIENAVKYRVPGEPPAIAVTAANVDDQWVVSVQDNGIGVDVSQHERIFELFRRGHTGYEGVGIGLAICQRIIERHGGEIWVESQPEEGATFSFSLPSEQEDSNGD